MELKVTKENVHQVFNVLVPFLEKIEKGYVASFLDDEQATLGMIFDGSEDSFDFISEKLVIVVDSVIDAELNDKERSELEKILQSTIGSELNEAEKEVEEVERFEVTVENLSESYDAVIKVLKEKSDDVALSSFENDYRILTLLFDGSERRDREVTEKLVALTQSAVDALDADGMKRFQEIVKDSILGQLPQEVVNKLSPDERKRVGEMLWEILHPNNIEKNELKNNTNSLFEVTTKNISESYDAVINVLKEKCDDETISNLERNRKILTSLLNGSIVREDVVDKALSRLLQDAVDKLDEKEVKEVKRIVTNATKPKNKTNSAQNIF